MSDLPAISLNPVGSFGLHGSTAFMIEHADANRYGDFVPPRAHSPRSFDLKFADPLHALFSLLIRSFFTAFIVKCRLSLLQKDDDHHRFGKLNPHEEHSPVVSDQISIEPSLDPSWQISDILGVVKNLLPRFSPPTTKIPLSTKPTFLVEHVISSRFCRPAWY